MKNRGPFALSRVGACNLLQGLKHTGPGEEGDDWFWPLRPLHTAALSLSIPFHLYLLFNYVGLERHKPHFMFLSDNATLGLLFHQFQINQMWDKSVLGWEFNGTENLGTLISRHVPRTVD